MAQKMFLYWGSGSIPCWKAMMALAEKGISVSDIGNKLISFDKDETKLDEIVKINPRAQVPTFKDGETIVNESGAICFYLEHKFADKGHRLLPEDLPSRGRVLQRVFEAENLFRMVIEDVGYYQFDHPKPEDQDQKHLEEKREAARAELKRWDGYLEKEGKGGYVVGRDFSMADVFVFPCVAFGVRCKLNLDKFPNLKDYYLRLKDRPSIAATWPPHWRETPGNTDYFSKV